MLAGYCPSHFHHLLLQKVAMKRVLIHNIIHIKHLTAGRRKEAEGSLSPIKCSNYQWLLKWKLAWCCVGILKSKVHMGTTREGIWEGIRWHHKCLLMIVVRQKKMGAKEARSGIKWDITLMQTSSFYTKQDLPFIHPHSHKHFPSSHLFIHSFIHSPFFHPTVHSCFF